MNDLLMSALPEDLADADSFIEPGNGNTPLVLETTSSLEGLQSVEQRNVLNIIDQLRKCGLESTLSLPQLVVCGDQSAGKSSVLEALTEVPFPRNDNLCTRFATEIILRRATSDAITTNETRDSFCILKVGRICLNSFGRNCKSWEISPLRIATAVLRFSSLLSQKYCRNSLFCEGLAIFSSSVARKIDSIVLPFPGPPDSYSSCEWEQSHES